MMNGYVPLALVLALAACGGPPIGPARAELIAAADRRATEGDASRALADYQAAAQHGALTSTERARMQQAAAALVESEIEAARALGERTGFDRLVGLRASLEAAQLPADPTLAAAIEAHGLALLERATRRTGWEGEVALIPAMREVLHVAAVGGSPALEAHAARLATEAGAHHLSRAQESGDAMLAADLHLRLAVSLGADLPESARRLIAQVDRELTSPIRITGGGQGCAELMDGVVDEVDRTSSEASPLTLDVELAITCDYQVGPASETVDGVVHSGIGHVLTVTGTVTRRFAGQSDTTSVAVTGRHGAQQDDGVYGKRAATAGAAQVIGERLEAARIQARAGLVDALRPNLASAQWRDRDSAAAWLWAVAHEPAAAEALRAAYGIDEAVLAALYGDDGIAPMPPAVAAEEAFALPSADEGPAVRALAAHRRKYGDRDRIDREARPVDFWRPGVGIGFAIATSPLTTVERAHTITGYVGGGPVHGFLEITRPGLGGDASGWELGWLPRLPLTEWWVASFGLSGGRQYGEGDDAHSHVSTGVALHRRTRYLLLSTGIDVNLLQVFGSTGAPLARQHFTPWHVAVELPLPVGPRLYVRAEAIRHLGATDDAWTWGLAIGLRKILADKY